MIVSRLISFTEPGVEVTDNHGVIVVYQRTGTALTPINTNDPDPSVRYLEWRHGAAGVTHGQTLLTGHSDAPLNHKYGYADPNEDLGGAALDPDGLTVWVSRAATDGAHHWLQVVGAIKP